MIEQQNQEKANCSFKCLVFRSDIGNILPCIVVPVQMCPTANKRVVWCISSHLFTADELMDHYATITSCAAPCSVNYFVTAISEISLIQQKNSLFEFSLVEAIEVHQLILSTLWDYYTHELFPEAWKRVFIKPLSKTSSPKLSSDIRPIANLSVFSKLFKRLIH
ncbi:hypothetical protein PV325_010407 [Microctonus aethiopoides]|nr:hypothetical protein PV325_010407 [Microctonus aethiopoides]